MMRTIYFPSNIAKNKWFVQSGRQTDNTLRRYNLINYLLFFTFYLVTFYKNVYIGKNIIFIKNIWIYYKYRLYRKNIIFHDNTTKTIELWPQAHVLAELTSKWYTFSIFLLRGLNIWWIFSIDEEWILTKQNRNKVVRGKATTNEDIPKDIPIYQA